MIAPKVKQLADQFAQIKFVEIDVDECQVLRFYQELSDELGVTAMPTILFFTNGVKSDEVIGANLAKLNAGVASLASDF